MSSPRSRLYSRLLALVSVLWAVGFALVCVRVRVLSRRLARASESFEVRFSAFESALANLPQAVPQSISPPETQAETQAQSSLPPFRVLGSGVLKNWDYVDVSFPDSTVSRYYSRRGDSRSASNTVARIREDSLYHVSRKETPDNPSLETF